jgi:hypothetical protein
MPGFYREFAQKVAPIAEEECKDGNIAVARAAVVGILAAGSLAAGTCAAVATEDTGSPGGAGLAPS